MNRTCTKCGAEKPATAEFFVKDLKRPGGLGSHCRACHLETCRAWAMRNREKVNADARAWRQRNIEKERERHRRDRAADPEKHREKVRRSYYKHQEKRLTARRAYGAIHRDKERAYGRAYHRLQQAQFPLNVKEQKARRRARKYGVAVEPVDYQAILERDGWLCHICGDLIASIAELVFDHVIPFAKGGAHLAANIKPAHYECNRAKNVKVMDENGYVSESV